MYIVNHDQFPMSYCATPLAARAQVQRLVREKLVEVPATATSLTYEICDGCHIAQVNPSYPLGTTSQARYKYFFYTDSHSVKPEYSTPHVLIGTIGFFIAPVFYWPLLLALNQAIHDVSFEYVTCTIAGEQKVIEFPLVSLLAQTSYFCMSEMQAIDLRTILLNRQEWFREQEQASLRNVSDLDITKDVM